VTSQPAIIAPSAQAQLEQDGYTVFRKAISGRRIDELLSRYLSLVAEISGETFEDAHGPDLVRYFGCSTRSSGSPIAAGTRS